MKARLRPLWRAYLFVLKAVTGALLVGIVLVTLVNVTMRYLLAEPIVWADEIARLGFICFSFLGAALGVASNAHLSIDTLVDRLPPRGKQVVGALISLAALAFFALLLFGGIEQSRNNFGQASPALRVPLGYIYAVVPLSAALMVVSMVGAMVFPPDREPENVPGRNNDPELEEPA